MKTCLICKKETKRPGLALLWHFRLVDFSMFKFFKGNKQLFGFWNALESISPLLQIPLAIKCRGQSLVIPKEFDGEIEDEI